MESQAGHGGSPASVLAGLHAVSPADPWAPAAPSPRGQQIRGSMGLGPASLLLWTTCAATHPDSPGHSHLFKEEDLESAFSHF